MMDLKVVTSNVLQEKVNALKKVCNPTCFSGNYAYYKIKSDIPTTEVYQMRLVADGLYSSEDSSVLSLIAYIDDATTISGNLSGLESMYIGLGSYIDNSNIAKYCIIVDSYGLQSLSAELFCGNLGGDEFDAKNHIVSIEGTDTLDEGVALIEIQNVNTLRDFYFYYVADDGRLMRVDNGGTVLSIDRSAISGQTENLKNSINVSVNSAVSSSVQITGLGTINSDLSGCSITLNAGQLPSPTVTIPAATTTELGGIKLFNSDSELLDGAYRVKLDLNNKAYVEVPKPDIHRYANLDNLTNLPVGTIVQYIGNTTSQYTNGYFYQYWPTSFTVDPIPSDSTWYALAGMADTIKAYNATVNYSLVPGIRINVSLVDESDSDASEGEVLFAVSLGSYTVDMTYEEIQQNLGIQLKNGYTVWDASDLTIYWRIAPNSDSIWVQKNVQPIMQMQSALVYQGSCTWDELLAKTSTAQPGDFYTVTDKSYQEYFFTKEGTWEFMGDVFTANGKYQVKTKVGSADPVTVSEFEANQSDTTAVTLILGNNVTLTSDTTNHTIEIAATDTQADWNETNTSSPAYINNKPTIPIAQVNADWNANSGVAEILNKPTIPTVQSADDYVTVKGTGGGSGTGTSISTYVPVGSIQMYAGETSPIGWMLCDGSNILVITCGLSDANVAFEYNGTYYKASDDNRISIAKVIKNNYSNGLPHAYRIVNDPTLYTGWVKTVSGSGILHVESITNDISDAYTDDSSTTTFDNVTVTPTQIPCIKVPNMCQRFPLGASSGTVGINNSDNRNGWSTVIGKDGGEDSHKLTTDESGLPSHHHSIGYMRSGTFGTTAASKNVWYSGDNTNHNTTDSSADAQQSHNNIPPFLAVNFIIKV